MTDNKVRLFEHFRHLNRFGGREERGSFWPYAALVYGIATVAGFVVMMPIMFSTFDAVRQAAPSGPLHPGLAGDGTGSAPPFESPNEVAAHFRLMIGAMSGVLLLTVYLYAAAVVRRLHDTGRSGWWGTIPLPFLAYSSAMMWRFFGNFGAPEAPDMRLFFSVFFSNITYMVALVALIVMLALASDPAENRYGPSGSGS